MMGAPEWVLEDPTLANAWELAESAHGSQPRASDCRPFVEHVAEVATLLHEAGFDSDLVAVGLLHDAVERGNLTEPELERAMGGSISSLVMNLSEDPSIESFGARKAALREQVAGAGDRATTVFAADKLSDILGLRRGLKTSGRSAVEERLGTSLTSMADHYRESVELIEAACPGSVFLPSLCRQLDLLKAETPVAAGSSGV
jgi:(p)ppGpp synthase/HD superfamily hydrolase